MVRRHFGSLLALMGRSGGRVSPRGGVRAEMRFAVHILNVPVGQLPNMAQLDGYGIHQAARWSHAGQRRVFDAVCANDVFDFFAASFDGSGLRKPGSGGAPRVVQRRPMGLRRWNYA
jgi:hypothetical protein